MRCQDSTFAVSPTGKVFISHTSLAGRAAKLAVALAGVGAEEGAADHLRAKLMLHHERSNKASETAVTRSPPSQQPAAQPSLPPAPPPPETDGYLTVLVTPKITFSLPRHTAWRTADDIGQELLRDAFLTRFPMRFDAEKLNFTCTTPALPLEGRSRLVYRISSAGDDEERVLLHILSALDKAYAKHFEKRFEEVRSDMLSSSMNFQIVADEVRLAQEAAEGKWEKAVKGLKEQLSVNQKRLFLLEREKEGLLKTVQTSDEQVVRLRRSVDALGVENDRMRTRQGDLESQIVALRELVTSVVGATASTAPTASAASAGPTTPAEVGAVVGADPGGAPCFSGVAAASSSSVGTPPTTASMPAGTAAASSSSVGTQTARAGSPPPEGSPTARYQTARAGGAESEADRVARLAVEKWQKAMGEWLRTGAEICSAAVAGAEGAVPMAKALPPPALASAAAVERGGGGGGGVSELESDDDESSGC